jgi:arylsulfatase
LVAKEAARIAIPLFGVGAIASVISGALSARDILATHRYLEHRMFRLTLDVLSEHWTSAARVYLPAAVFLTVAALLVSRIWGPRSIKDILQRRLPQAVGYLGIGIFIVLSTVVWLDGTFFRPKGPNVIFIVVDTLRSDHIGSHGYFRPTSPSIDRFAEDSIVFVNAQCQAPWTTASIGSLLTSRYPEELGLRDSIHPARTDDRFLFLAEIFKDNGYRTHAVVSHTYIGSPLGFAQGFDTFDEENAQGHAHISSPSLTDKAISFLESNEEEPFFLFLHYFDPHFSYVLHQPFDYYPDYRGPIPSGMPYRDLVQSIPEMSEEDIQYVLALYDSEIRFTDEHVGEFLNALKERDFYDDSLIIFTADHGEAFLDREDKKIGHERTLYQELIRVPLMIKLAGKSSRVIVDQQVGLVDLVPTLLAHLGISTPRSYRLDGRVLPLGDAQALSKMEPQPVFSETKARGRWIQSVTWDHWKLIHNRKFDIHMLFDLAEDPGEMSAVNENNPEILDNLKAALNLWSNELEQKSRGVKVSQPEFSPEQLEQLRSLGYVQ